MIARWLEPRELVLTVVREEDLFESPSRKSLENLHIHLSVCQCKALAEGYCVLNCDLSDESGRG